MLDSSSGLSKQSEELMLSDEQLEIITRDPATFALTTFITNPEEWLLKDLYAKVPTQLHDLLDSILDSFQKNGTVEIRDSKLYPKKKNFRTVNKENLNYFLPKVFEIAAKKVLERPLDEFKKEREGIRYFAIPNSPDVALEAQILYKEFNAKMESLMARAIENATGKEDHRLVGIVSYKMDVEDFV